MPEITRGLGNLTIHFMGDNAGQLAATFDSAYGRSSRFQGEMADAASRFRYFYVGSSLDDVASAPGYKNIDWSQVPTGEQAFSKAGGPDSYFIVAKGAAHDLIQDGKSFTGTPELELVHEFLHPMQMMRDWSEARINPFGETQVQMREQGIAEELGYRTGETFPDVLGTGTPYQVVSPESDPLIHPMRYGAPAGAAPVLSGPQMAPQQVPAPSASPIDVPVPPALQPLVPFFFPQGLNTRSTRAWPSTGTADGPDTPGPYSGPLPRALSSPTGQFGGALIPGGPFGSVQLNQANDGGALAAFPSQTQMVPQQAPAPLPIDVPLPPALQRLLPLFFAPDGSPTDFGRGLSAPGATAEMTPQADQIRSAGALSAPSGRAQLNSQQAPTPQPPWIDAVPPELRILVPFFFPQGFDNG